MSLVVSTVFSSSTSMSTFATTSDVLLVALTSLLVHVIVSMLHVDACAFIQRKHVHKQQQTAMLKTTIRLLATSPPHALHSHSHTHTRHTQSTRSTLHRIATNTSQQLALLECARRIVGCWPSTALSWLVIEHCRRLRVVRI